MPQNKKEMLELFKESLQNASKEEPEHFGFSEAAEVRIIFYGHYPEYNDDFELIEKKLNSFFDFSDEDLLDIG